MQHPFRVLMVSGAALALPALGIAAPAVAAPSGPPAVLHVGQIGRQNVAPHGNCEPDTLVEPDIAVSPFNTKIEVAVAHDCRFASGGAVDIFYAWTHDGGAEACQRYGRARDHECAERDVHGASQLSPVRPAARARRTIDTVQPVSAPEEGKGHGRR